MECTTNIAATRPEALVTMWEHVTTSERLSTTAVLRLLLVVTVIMFAIQQVHRPPMGKGAPKLGVSMIPVIGAMRYYTRRGDFFADNIRASDTGNFSFYFGKKRIVGVSSEEARRAYHESRDLDFNIGSA
jgi:hypothetical protein